MLKYENSPRWFALSFKGGKRPAIRITVWKNCVDQLTKVLAAHRGVPETIASWGLESWECGEREGFGFDRVVCPKGLQDGYLVLEAALSREKVVATAVSMQYLLNTLQHLPMFCKEILATEFTPDYTRRQLMTLECALLRNMNLSAAPLGGVVAPIFTDWVESISARGRLLEVEEAMWLTWNALSEYGVGKEKGPNPFPSFSSRVGEKGSFFISCIGNACDVGTYEWWESESGEGHELACHNLDSPLQQLSLLAGLAKMHDLARRDIDQRPPR